MGIHKKRSSALFVGLYAWITTIFVGAILLDIFYARLAPLATFVSSEGSDFLLLIGFVTFLAGLIAITFSWKSRVARTLLIASLLVFSFEFVLPTFISKLMPNSQIDDLGPWLRITPVGLSSILAFFGIYNFIIYQE